MWYRHAVPLSLAHVANQFSARAPSVDCASPSRSSGRRMLWVVPGVPLGIRREGIREHPTQRMTISKWSWQLQMRSKGLAYISGVLYAKSCASQSYGLVHLGVKEVVWDPWARNWQAAEAWLGTGLNPAGDGSFCGCCLHFTVCKASPFEVFNPGQSPVSGLSAQLPW